MYFQESSSGVRTPDHWLSANLRDYSAIERGMGLTLALSLAILGHLNFCNKKARSILSKITNKAK